MLLRLTCNLYLEVPSLLVAINLAFLGLPNRYVVEFLLATPLQLYFAIPIYQSAWSALRYAGAFDMDSLIAISTSVAYVAIGGPCYSSPHIDISIRLELLLLSLYLMVPHHPLY